MAEIKKPNTICRNPNCTNGDDGKRKYFYACLTCMRKEQWRAYCCCFDCYEEYTRIVLAERAKNKTAAPLPDRTDMTEQEIRNVMQKPVEEVEEYTKTVELPDYVAENPNSPLAEIIDKVNEDIDQTKKKRSRKKITF